MSRVRIPAGTGDAKGLRAEEDFPHSRGRSSGTQENILRTVIAPVTGDGVLS